MKIIAHIHTDFKEKFGIPRQSGLADGLVGRIVFLPEYRRREAFRGLEGYSHIWVIWNFSKAERDSWSPTVRPPRLGGNKRVGVFATRSPFRPNPIGLSSLKLLRIEEDRELGPVLVVSGADMLDGTPIYDVKPYLPFTDSHPDAVGGFTEEVRGYSLPVDFPEELLLKVDEERRESLLEMLSSDPRPSYHTDDRVYTFAFANYEISFRFINGRITVTDVKSAELD
ncbi:MAG: tRNA (N6-threonylcarbamoyladenosine(37)-N6)-methyltransferase TrmO [Clostridia bacterium]|nr:tRNA (N6-threonylcarbamoyladenosine(37)-N6)-methyltransferase TrmO [Clostridia bacterium]